MRGVGEDGRRSGMEGCKGKGRLHNNKEGRRGRDREMLREEKEGVNEKQFCPG